MGSFQRLQERCGDYEAGQQACTYTRALGVNSSKRSLEDDIPFNPVNYNLNVIMIYQLVHRIVRRLPCGSR